MAIQRTRHTTPTIDEIISDLSGSTTFSKLDLNQGYHQLILLPESRFITTFSTHLGLKRYKRLNFGINCASEIFQHAVRSTLKGIMNMINVSDDILIHSPDAESHKNTLRQVFTRLAQNGLTLKKDKCHLFKSTLKYLGFIFTADGVKPDTEKVTSVKQAPPPTNATEVRSFMGMVNYSARFIPNLATLSEPLMRLTHKNSEWDWTPCHQKAFETIQRTLTEDVLSYYDPQRETTVFVDASPCGVGAILTQSDDQHTYIISYASRALTPVERRYSQLEKEALAIVFGCEKYRLYILGKPVNIITDHKPLVPMFTNPHLQLPAKIERWILRLQQYHMRVTYSPGKGNPADYMSRPHHTNSSRENEQQTERYLNFLISTCTPQALTPDIIKRETAKDRILQRVITAINTSNWNHPGNDSTDKEVIQIFAKVRNELTVDPENTIVLKGNRIVIPTALQNQAIASAHEGHQGLVKSKALIRTKVWFPSMDRMLEECIKNCLPCQAITTSKRQMPPLHMTPLPPQPWHHLSADFFGPLPSGEYLQVIIDDYSRYPIVEIINSTSARAVIPAFDRTFALFGIPDSV